MTLAWFFRDEVTEATVSVQEMVARYGAVVPALWHLEVGSGLRIAERRKRVDAGFVARAIANLGSLRIEVDSETARHAWSATMRLAAAHDLTIYDASYLELAVRRGLPIASLDRAMCQAAAALGVATARH